MIGIHYLLQGLLKITYQRAADTAGIELLYLHTGFLHKAAVNGNLAKFIFNQGNLVCKAVTNQLLDERSLACAQKT